MRCRRIERRLVSHDPRRRAILARIRYTWRHLPPNGVLLFFDVQPIAVKAYGGRKFTSETHPVLDKRQKTRGYFYLFVAYEVNTGRRRWAFFDSKSSDQVIEFMRWIHRCYPDRWICIVLDRDSPHPWKSRKTRRAMRQMKLHWISLPTGSPDDNPVEVIFSDIQLMVLDTTNDPDTKTTQRRIGQHLTRINRGKNRRIRIPYLPDSDKS